MDSTIALVTKGATRGAVVLAFIAATTTGVHADAHAAEPRAHFEVAGAHFLSIAGAWQGREIGLGGVLAGAIELGLS